MVALTITARAPAPPPDSVPAFAFIAGLAEFGFITDAEADAWVARNALPLVVETVLATRPSAERRAARMRALGMSQAERRSALLMAALDTVGADEADRDDLFRWADAVARADDPT